MRWRIFLCFLLCMSFQFGEPSAHRNVVPELVRDIQDSAVVLNVSPVSSLEPACRDALALLAMTFAVHELGILCFLGYRSDPASNVSPP